MKRLSVFLVLVLTLGTIFALTSCGCEASNQTDQNGQTSTPNENANNGNTSNGNTSNGNTNDGQTNGNTSPNNGSLADDVIDGGEDIVDGVIEGGKDVVDGVGDAITGDNHNNGNNNGAAGNNGTTGNGTASSDLPTYEDMVRNGRVQD